MKNFRLLLEKKNVWVNLPFLLNLFFLTFTSCYSQEVKKERIAPSYPKPNVIYILTDDLGYGDLSSYGQKKFQTPHIDNLARKGLKFNRHYSGSTVCAPSRSSLMTGKHTGKTIIRGNYYQRKRYPPLKGGLSLARLFKRHDYATGVFGKWGLGAINTSGSPLNQGFDEFFGYVDQKKAHQYYPKFLYKNRKKIFLKGEYSQDLVFKETFKFIRKNKKKNFFCYLSVNIPHAAMQAPKKLHDKWRKVFPEYDKLIGRYTGGIKVKNPIAAFPAMMEYLDNKIGDLVSLLSNLGILENTLIIFTSDNGPHNAGGHDSRFWNSNGLLRGYKRDLYEGGIRVPMIAYWKGVVKSGETKHISAFWDVLPTMADLLKDKDYQAAEGSISFLPTLLGNFHQQEKHKYLYWEFFYKNVFKQALILDDLKIIIKDNKFEVYDLNKDEGESKNLIKKYPKIENKAKKLISKIRTPDILRKK